MNGSDETDVRPRFLTDEDFNLHIVAGLRRFEPGVDIVTVQKAQLLGAPDPDIPAYAQAQNRILLTHDKQTMPVHFAVFVQRLAEGEHSPGVMDIPQMFPIGAATTAIHFVWSASTHEEWRDQETYLPL
jgi:hypothetical protein